MAGNVLSKQAQEIIQRWDIWRRAHPSAGDIEFLAFLQREHPEALNFKTSRVNEKWRSIHAWLIRSGRIKD